MHEGYRHVDAYQQLRCPVAGCSEAVTLGRGHLLPVQWHLMRNLSLAQQLAAHVSIGAICLTGVLTTLYRAERRPLSDAIRLWRTRNHEEKTH